MSPLDLERPPLDEPSTRRFDSWRWAAFAILLGSAGAALAARLALLASGR